MVIVRGEREAIDLAIETVQLDRCLHRARIQRLAALVGVQAVLRRHAVLEDGDLEREVSLAQQSPVVRSAFEFAGRGGRVAAFGGVMPAVGAAGGQQQGEDQGEQSDHGVSSWAFAVRRSTSTSSKW